MATVTGYVEKIKYRNDENGYSVLSVADGKEKYVLVGTFAYIAEGERIEATGRMVEHSIYGEQLSVESYEIKPPEDTLAIERYLGSGAIKGIGAALAKRIVKKFKADTFRIIEEEPERLSEVKGISERMAMEISSQVEEKRELRQAMLFLQQYGIHFAMDDYGTGNASSSIVLGVPMNEIKIDMSFIKGILNNEKQQMLVKNIVNFARSTNMKSCIEGVEDKSL